MSLEPTLTKKRVIGNFWQKNQKKSQRATETFVKNLAA
jgi:hypothetical protein